MNQSTTTKKNQSEPIWIKNRKESCCESDPSSSYDSGFTSSSSSSKIGSMTSNNSLFSSGPPPEYKRSYSSGSYKTSTDQSNDYNYSRRRTKTINGCDEHSLFSSPPTSPTSAFSSPFRRSNSISGNEPPNFGGIIKKSMGQLFNAATMNTSLATAPIQKSVPKVKCMPKIDSGLFNRKMSNDRINNEQQNHQFTDHMVSFLCESAIR